MLTVGAAPLSWGVFEGDARANPAWAVVLDEIAEAGYEQLELGPIGFLPEDPQRLKVELDTRGLSLTAGFVYEHMHDPDHYDTVLRNTRRVGEVLAALDADYLVIIDRMVPERQRTAGRSEDAIRLGSGAWDRLVTTIATVAEIAVEEFGLRPVLHPHCGTHIEFSDEIEKALTALAASQIGLCIDTGHTIVAGMQSAELASQYAERLEYFHLKDVHADALRRMRDEHLEFDDALATGLFCPLGQGIVDFKALRERISTHGFVGSATVEQDPDPQAAFASGLTAARESLAFLREIGLAAALDAHDDEIPTRQPKASGNTESAPPRKRP
jgi:inosose dehydratase